MHLDESSLSERNYACWDRSLRHLDTIVDSAASSIVVVAFYSRVILSLSIKTPMKWQNNCLLRGEDTAHRQISNDARLGKCFCMVGDALGE